eukprot:753986-Hanusia_phi.AAC.2
MRMGMINLSLVIRIITCHTGETILHQSYLLLNKTFALFSKQRMHSATTSRTQQSHNIIATSFDQEKAELTWAPHGHR